MCLGDKLIIQLIMLELRRRHSRMILQQRYPSFCIIIFDMVDSMMIVWSNTNRQRFLKHRSWMHLLKIVIPKGIQEHWGYPRIHYYLVSRKCCFLGKMMRNMRVAIRSKQLIQCGKLWRLECKQMCEHFLIRIYLNIRAYILGIWLNLNIHIA